MTLPERSQVDRRFAEANGRKRQTNELCGMWERHHTIARLLALGRSNVEIAEVLNITPQTVSNTRNDPIVKAKIKREVANRNHEDLKGNKVTCHEHEDDPDVRTKLVDPQLEPRETRQGNGPKHSRHRDENRVQQVSGHVAFKEHTPLVIREFERRRQPPVVADREVRGRFDREDHDRNQRQ